MRRFVLAGIDILARALGISTRTARRRAAAMPGAAKVRGQWVIPLDTATYARGAGVSRRTAQRRGVAAESPTAAAVQSRMPTNLPPSGSVRWTRVPANRLVNARIWPWQAQGWAWVRFLASGDVVQVFSGTLVFRSRPSTKALIRKIKEDIMAYFTGTSPIEILAIGLVYAWTAA